MIKKITIMLMFILIAGQVSCSFNNNADIVERQVIIIEEESYFHDFVVKSNKVYLSCDITVKNLMDQDASFYLIGNFIEDEGRLLAKGRLSAKNIETKDNLFHIGEYETKTYAVVFIGEYAGTYEKHDRLLPELEIELNEKTTEEQA